jgi:hypothetical protein
VDTADAWDSGIVEMGAADSSSGDTASEEGPGSPWESPPINEATVYAFSQVGTSGRDPQLLDLAPDVVIRAWQWWDTDGHRVSDYDFSYARDAHARGITFSGGGTASVLFQDEFPDPAQFDAIVSRDASGAIPPRTQPPVLYRASLANPSYRQYLVDAAKLQIDGGVDGLFFDELNGSYSGVNWDGNEGFDDLQIGDFNAFLLNRYPESTDFGTLFGMDPSNTLRRDVPANDITKNFNYRQYLSAKGWASTPMSSANPLALLWGGTIGNLPDPAATGFVDTVVTNKYWKEIADAVRTYARDRYGRTVFLTANGIWPYVDFQSVGLYDYNQHGTTSGSYVD